VQYGAIVLLDDEDPPGSLSFVPPAPTSIEHPTDCASFNLEGTSDSVICQGILGRTG
jgi:hypothetical protein